MLLSLVVVVVVVVGSSSSNIIVVVLIITIVMIIVLVAVIIIIAASFARSDIFQTGSLWSHSQCPVGLANARPESFGCVWVVCICTYVCVCIRVSLSCFVAVTWCSMM